MRVGDTSELVFYIRHSHGLTKKLYDHAQKFPDAPVSVMIDGPYGGINMQRFNEADRLLIIAGGSGAGWILSFVELFCRQWSAAADGAFEKDVKYGDEETQSQQNWQHRSLRVVLATRDTSSRTWFLDAVAKLLAEHAAPQQTPNVEVHVHLTGEAEESAHISKQMDVTTGQCASSSSSDDIGVKAEDNYATLPSEEVRGRPDLPLTIRQEGAVAAEDGQSLSVYVCGPTTMQHEVRNAVAKENLGILGGSKSRGVYLHSEHFSWA